ncbi:universal stress protein [Candidatus Solincola sp.]|jgi:nucleotide-binding universal stress UspA family protein|nr:universal stress protein [Actinomycetota bacterium]MDI7253275.1 universal stress protein [Actinomycetota bacterium]
MLERVLLPVDGSETSKKAVDFAVRLLEKSGCRVTLLAVVEEPAYAAFWSDGMIAPEVVLPPPEELRGELEKRAGRMLEESSTPVKEAGLEVETLVRFGSAASEILREAEEGGYDLVIMGSHGRGVLGGFLLGSVSNRVVHHARCPVLIVRGP